MICVHVQRWLGVLALVVGGCATTRVATDLDPRVDFAKYQTFEVKGGQVIREGIPDPGDTLVKDRVDAALTAELAEKGLRPDPADPDLIVRFRNETHSEPEPAYYPGWNYYGWDPLWAGGPYWGPYWRYPYYPDIIWVKEGNLTIDLVDANTNKLVYRGNVEADDKHFRSPDYIRKAVDKALSKFPQPKPTAVS